MTITLFFRKPRGYPFIFISGEIEQFVPSLDKELSYPVQNAEYAQAALADRHARENQKRVENGQPIMEYPPWDGRVHFLRKSKNGRWYFPIGLLERARKLLSWYDVEISTKLEYDEYGESDEFEWHGPDLRDYQNETVVKAISKAGGVICLPTGGGKTLCALRLIYATGLQTIILVHRRQLYSQWCDKIKEVFGFPDPMWVYGGDKRGKGSSASIFCRVSGNHSFGSKIVIAMVQSLHSGKRESSQLVNDIFSKKYDLLIVDESHHIPSDLFYSVAMKIDARFKYGFSATVKREDGEDMKTEAAIGPIIYTKKADGLIESGHLSVPVFEFINIPATNVTGKTFPQVYKSGIVMNNDRNYAIANRVKELVSEGRQVYIHVERINHGKILSEMMRVPFVCSGSKHREETIDTFKKGRTRALISTLLGEGVDIPEISAICMAGGMKTEIGTIQKIGRALRPDKKFGNSIIVDFADRGDYLADHSQARFNSYVKFYGEKYVLRGGK